MNVRLGIPVVRTATDGDSPDTSAVLRTRTLESTRSELDSRAHDAPSEPGLHDRYGRMGTDLRISLTDKCNLRCTYCMPADGMDWMPQPSLLTSAEVIRLVDIAVTVHGVRDLRLTGGEPLIRPDLEEIIAGIRAHHPDLPIALTTNGIGLARRAASLAKAGLTRLNVSLDTIDADTFRTLARRDRLADVLAGIDAALDAGLHPVKLNAVLMRDVNADQAPELLAYALERGVFLRFIEQMPLDGDHGWTRAGMVTSAEVRSLLGQHWQLMPDDAPRDGAPAELWRVLPLDTAETTDTDDTANTNGTATEDPAGSQTNPGPADSQTSPAAASAEESQVLGRVGVIASVTEPFCSACTRTRITADGKIRSCLFSHEEFDLASALRSGETDEVVARMWQQAMWLKPAAHGMDAPGLDSDEYVQPDRTMSAIGG